MSGSFERSVELLARAERTIPLGSQTFSKSKTQFPVGVSPLFAASGKGAELVDVDGNRYVAFINGLGAVLIGDADERVNAAVAELARGTAETAVQGSVTCRSDV